MDDGFSKLFRISTPPVFGSSLLRTSAITSQPLGLRTLFASSK
uniref:Uncharacterized protein n=1 Tax=Arundo donax TaxID=35708 RepID=A0A0A9A3J3_ARUDO